MSEQPRPDDGADDRPWERPGSVRRDCEPHRGALYALLRLASEVCFLLALFCPPFALVALGVGVTTWLLARHDLREMEAGRMDPAGRKAAVRAHQRGRNCAIFAIFWLPIALALIIFLATQQAPAPTPDPPRKLLPLEVSGAGVPD
jgi:hypothetical protein